MYLSKVMHDTTIREYANKKISVIGSIPILKFNSSQYHIKSMNISYDIFTIISYIRSSYSYKT